MFNVLPPPLNIAVVLILTFDDKEFILNIPRKYKFFCQKISYIIPSKREEYSLLKDFLKSSKEMVIESLKISSALYKQLLFALDICVIKKFSTLNTFMKNVKIFKKFFSKN